MVAVVAVEVVVVVVVVDLMDDILLYLCVTWLISVTIKHNCMFIL